MEYFDDIEWIENKFGPYICYSGGAAGADTIFEEECTKKNIEVVAFSFNNHNTKSKNRKILTKEELNEGNDHVIKANETLKRNIYGLKPYVRNLLSRDWFQVKNSDAVYAVGVIQKSNRNIVNGGTGWAVQMAIDNKIPVYVFDQEEGCWFEYGIIRDKDTLAEIGGRFFTNKDSILLPKLTKKFAGVGTRDINEKGIRAIRELIGTIK